MSSEPSTVTKGFQIDCKVMGAIINPWSENVNGNDGMVFESYADQQAWQNKAVSDLGGFWFSTVGSFSGYWYTRTTTYYTELISGGHARVKIGYSSAGGGHPTNYDITESTGPKKCAFGLRGTISSTSMSTQIQEYSILFQGGEMPYGYTSTYSTRTGPNGTVTASAIFQLIDYEQYSQWAIDLGHDQEYTVAYGPYAPGEGPNLGYAGTPQTQTFIRSGEFNYTPSEYFT